MVSWSTGAENQRGTDGNRGMSAVSMIVGRADEYMKWRVVRALFSRGNVLQMLERVVKEKRTGGCCWRWTFPTAC